MQINTGSLTVKFMVCDDHMCFVNICCLEHKTINQRSQDIYQTLKQQNRMSVQFIVIINYRVRFYGHLVLKANPVRN